MISRERQKYSSLSHPYHIFRSPLFNHLYDKIEGGEISLELIVRESVVLLSFSKIKKLEPKFAKIFNFSQKYSFAINCKT